MNLTEEQFTNWLDTMGKAWITKDADLATNLFDDNATYKATPYREPHRGKDEIHHYWESNMKDQEDIKFNYEILSVKDNSGIAHAWGSYIQDGKKEEWDGIFWAIFNDEGKCVTWREWWVTK